MKENTNLKILCLLIIILIGVLCWVNYDNFFINNKEVSVYGSQGQNRTVVLSLKLAELQVIKDDIDDYPILLLDDFMSELDSNRRKSFLNNIENTQIIITCTDPIEIEKFNKNVEYKLYNVKKGEVF